MNTRNYVFNSVSVITVITNYLFEFFAAKKVIPSMAFVDWQNKSALEIYNQHRALSDLYLLRTYWFGSLLKLSDISLDQVIGMNPENRRSLQSFRMDGEIFPGLVEFSKKRCLLRVQCKDGKWICVKHVICGKKCLSPSEFYNGYLSKIENSLERRFNSNGIQWEHLSCLSLPFSC